MNLVDLRKKYEEIVRYVPRQEELEQLTEAALAFALAELAKIVVDDSIEAGVRVNAAAVLASYGRLMTQRAALKAQLEIERMRLRRRAGEIEIEEVPVHEASFVSQAN